MGGLPKETQVEINPTWKIEKDGTRHWRPFVCGEPLRKFTSKKAAQAFAQSFIECLPAAARICGRALDEYYKRQENP